MTDLHSALRPAVVVIAVCTAIVSADAQSASQPAVVQPPLYNSATDPGLVEAEDNVIETQRLSKHAHGPEKDFPDIGKLESEARAGDVEAAIAFAERTRNARSLAVPQELVVLAPMLQKGVAAGVPKAYLSMADVELKRGELKSAIRHLQDASKRGEAEADFRLALIKAQHGQIGDVDETAWDLVLRAAERGNAVAALEVGLALKQGVWRLDAQHAVACTHSPEKGAAWIERAAFLGNAEAGLWIGLYYMRVATGLADLRREKALQYLLTARRAETALKDPETGLTFAEIEAAGGIEEGLLSELKRRESQLKADAAKPRTSETAERNKPAGAPVQRRRIDHAILSIIGDEEGGKPVYNIFGISPYQEIACEATVHGQLDPAAIPRQYLLGTLNPHRWWVETVVQGKIAAAVPLPTQRQLTPMGAAGLKQSKGETSFRIVRYHSFFSVFGRDNRVGLKPGSRAVDADEVTVYDARTAATRRFYYDAELIRWVNSSSGEPLTEDFDLLPGAGMVLKRTEPGALVLQARGTLPSVDFDLTPADDTMIVSVRKNSLSARASTRKPAEARTAGDLPVMALNGSTSGEESRDEAWWSRFGLQASDLVKISSGSAAVLVNR